MLFGRVYVCMQSPLLCVCAHPQGLLAAGNTKPLQSLPELNQLFQNNCTALYICVHDPMHHSLWKDLCVCPHAL